MNQKDLVRFWNHVNKKGPVHPLLRTRCWLWTAARDQDGYGLFKALGKMHKAHRVSLLGYKKHPTLCVLHRCDNPSCVRPSHLFEGTTRQNNEDRAAKGRSAVGTRNGGGVKLTEQLVRMIREHPDNGAALATRLGVSKSTVSRIRRHETWKHVP